MNNALQVLVDFCKQAYQSSNPLGEFDKLNGPMPEGIKKHLQEWKGTILYPEPYYGYFEEDMSRDTLLLLRYPTEVKETEERMNRWNSFVQERYQTWEKEDYLDEKNRLADILGKGYKWREKSRKQIENIVGETGFLHTIQYFLYHTKIYPFPEKSNMDWIHNAKLTQMIVQAIRLIAEQRKVKYIFGIGKAWVDELNHHPDTFTLSGYREILKPGTGGISHRIYKYQVGESSLPIIIYISGAGSMNMPTDERAVDAIKQMLE